MRLILIILLFVSRPLFAGPFTECPSEAYLVQGNPAQMYGVDLSSGSYETVANALGNNNKFNGMGFSVHDDYIYGWDYATGLARLHSDYTLESLSVTGVPSGDGPNGKTTFYVGDVSTTENIYYAFSRKAGLYKISLDAASPNYLQMTEILPNSSFNPSISDFAIHPTTNLAYSVNQPGFLQRFNLTTGEIYTIADTGEPGIYGAAYFDPDDNLYVSRNSDGKIFRIDISNGDTELFANGPVSSTNDGARCPSAPIVDPTTDPTMDYGDAPNSYSTNLESNGARHKIGSLYFGSGVSAEHTPNSPDDDDGVSFLTGLETGYDSLLSFTASYDGYVNAWVDWNQDGTFENSEQILTGFFASAGETRLLIQVPYDATTGATWARFRISDDSELAVTGGIDNGEVEDLYISIVDSGVSETTTGWQTAAFEDLWPDKGDYDFNDVVVKYRVTRSEVGDQVTRFKVDGYLMAVGASYRNGFGLRFNGIQRFDVDSSSIRYSIDGVQLDVNPLESGRTEAIMIPFPDTRDVAPVLSGCQAFRTEGSCASQQQPISFVITLPLTNSYSVSVATLDGVTPFIFGVNGYHHGPHVDAANARAWEVHLKNHEPTEAFDSNYYDLGDDDSTSQGNFQTANGLPWALIIGNTWSHPRERVDITVAYPEFQNFAETSGNQNPTWFNNPTSDKVID